MAPMNDYEFYNVEDSVPTLPDTFHGLVWYKLTEWFDSQVWVAQVFFILLLTGFLCLGLLYCYNYLATIRLENVVGGHLSKRRLFEEFEHLKQPGVIWFDNKVVRYPPTEFEVKLIQKLQVWLNALYEE